MRVCVCVLCMFNGGPGQHSFFSRIVSCRFSEPCTIFNTLPTTMNRKKRDLLLQRSSHVSKKTSNLYTTFVKLIYELLERRFTAPIDPAVLRLT